MKQKLLPERGEAETGKNQEEREDASPSDDGKDTEKKRNREEGEEESDLKEEETAGPETMPEIGSLDFDKWFEENCEEEALWQQILGYSKEQ